MEHKKCDCPECKKQVEEATKLFEDSDGHLVLTIKDPNEVAVIIKGDFTHLSRALAHTMGVDKEVAEVIQRAFIYYVKARAGDIVGNLEERRTKPPTPMGQPGKA